MNETMTRRWNDLTTAEKDHVVQVRLLGAKRCYHACEITRDLWRCEECDFQGTGIEVLQHIELPYFTTSITAAFSLFQQLSHDVLAACLQELMPVDKHHSSIWMLTLSAERMCTTALRVVGVPGIVF